MFQDVSRCFGVGNLGHYEMTRATKMTPVNLWYKLQMLGNPFHREPEAESGLVSGCFRMFRDVSGWEIWVTMKWHAPPKWPRWTCDTSYKCLETHFIENQRLKVVWFQDVSGCFEMFRGRKSGSLWNDTRHQNDPGEPVIQATNAWKPISWRTRGWKWFGFRMFQDVSRCFGVGNLGHYEMTRATKMTPVNLWYKLQMLGIPFHREPEAESGLVSGCFRMFRNVSGWEIWVTIKWHAPPKWPRWTCDTSYKCLESHFIENQRLKVVWFQDVSGCFEMFWGGKSGSLWNDTRHQNDPGEPVIQATNAWKPIS